MKTVNVWRDITCKQLGFFIVFSEPCHFREATQWKDSDQKSPSTIQGQFGFHFVQIVLFTLLSFYIHFEEVRLGRRFLIVFFSLYFTFKGFSRFSKKDKTVCFWFIQVTVPYQARLLRGNLTYDPTVLQFFLGGKNELLSRTLDVQNQFALPIMIHNATLDEALQPYFEVSSLMIWK